MFHRPLLANAILLPFPIHKSCPMEIFCSHSRIENFLKQNKRLFFLRRFLAPLQTLKHKTNSIVQQRQQKIAHRLV